ncbi:TlpA family protein disulfide reductase [Burkholderia gladioli]|uniref:Prolipodiacylglyceryl transferase family protein n=1 Tax=Burkholderia gladioli TaxID=28095 RepID=A0AAW3EQ51_BURGA|nr:TlpA disulfide reductase family protein [Burkholderia gladioli]AJW97218.1 prolipodiacylglyceryl transferase family protein [Burkholderia gladioli]ASD78833.1 redoxin [Burkholderia gladioli pv. gladioli]AWY55920.1 redoxin [Burkholderia gladioli pv. gladioli]KGC09643.1 prolipodiacylglyceryl transferase family protein [Burkholderia gladioli]MBU9323559.1 TlpA family protein disulfide reductase [Burkholderia gladioli]
MTSIGPFSVQVVALAAAALLAWLIALGLARTLPGEADRRAASLLVDALLVGLLVARLAYVLRWWPQYAAAPASIVAIGDGGFSAWAGLAAALVLLAWRLRRRPAARRPVLGGLLVGLAAWGIAQGVLGSIRDNAPPLDTLAISTLDAKPVAPGRFADKPVILNLWASWCPPCRREMPVLAQAQAAHPELTVLMLNQGEDASTVRGFLSQMGLRFDEVMLDPRRDAMRVYGSRGLPTTLFFDARGHLVESHVGEITAARLEDILQRQFDH